MKKAIFTMAIFVMAFGSTSFAQSKANLRDMSKQYVLKQMGLVRESYIVPQQANYSEVDGTQHRTTYYYDEWDFTLTEEVIETYDDSWVNQSRGLYEYDFNGNVLEALIQKWNEDDWEDMMKMTYDYDGDILNEAILQLYMDGMWINASKEVYNYNGDTWTVLYWIWNGTTWSSNLLYTYTRNGNTIELLMQYMEGGAWQNEGKKISTLDFDENVTEILYQVWENNTWVNCEKTTYNYDDGVYNEKLLQVWYDSSWKDKNYFTFEYDGAGNAKHGNCFAFDDVETWVPANGDIEMAYGYNAEKVVYSGTDVDMVYIDLTSVNENTQASNIKVYPVPAENEIQIQAEGFQKAEIYTLTGQLLMESLQSKVDVSGLAVGVYMLKVFNQDGNVETQRIVVK